MSEAAIQIRSMTVSHGPGGVRCLSEAAIQIRSMTVSHGPGGVRCSSEAAILNLAPSIHASPCGRETGYAGPCAFSPSLLSTSYSTRAELPGAERWSYQAKSRVKHPCLEVGGQDASVPAHSAPAYSALAAVPGPNFPGHALGLTCYTMY